MLCNYTFCKKKTQKNPWVTPLFSVPQFFLVAINRLEGNSKQKSSSSMPFWCISWSTKCRLGLLYIVLGLRVAITQNYWCIVKLDKMNMQNIMGQFFSLESHRSKDLQQIMKLVWWQITFEYWIIWLDYWMYDKWLWE
jgi:hypothetical protein